MSDSKFAGFHRAIVVDNDDPLKAGRVRVKVMPFFSGIPDDKCPWAIVADASMGGISNIGAANIPVVGSHVWIFFEACDYRHPVYFAGAPAVTTDGPDIPARSREESDENATIANQRQTGIAIAGGGSWDEPESAYAAQYPYNRVYRSQEGILVEIDDTPGNVRLHIYHPSGTRSEVDTAGNKVEHVAADKTTVALGKKQVKVSSSMDVNVGGSLTVKADGGTTIESNVEIIGTLHVTDVVTGDATLTMADTITSTGGDVVDSKSSMQDMRDTYNQHDHNKAVGAPLKQMT